MTVGLGEKHLQVLAAVVEEYILQPEPVGSKTIARSRLKTSSATIRNLMADLEKMGLLEKPHASAGRLPTHLGIRRYVDSLAGTSPISDADRGRIEALTAAHTHEDLVGDTAALLSELSRQVGVILFLPAENLPLKSIHLISAAGRRIRVHFNFQGGLAEERAIANEWDLDAGALVRLQNLVNHLAPGRTLLSLRLELLRHLDRAKAQADRLLARAVEFSARLVETDEPELIVRGGHNLLEGADGQTIGDIKAALRSLEEKAMIVRILAEAQLARGVRTFIGDEIASPAMRCCSLVVATYGRDEIATGTIGVIGPTRMDYARIIPLVDFTSGLFSRRLAGLDRSDMTREVEV